MKKRKRTFPFLILATFMIIVLNAINVSAKTSEILQFTANGHVLGFEKTGLYVTTGSHALRIDFAGTKGATPEAITDTSDSKKVMPLKKVRYSGLWKGITLAYTHTDKNIFESTYYIEPNANVEDIKLVYNVPVETAENGSLNLNFETGYMTESPPVAWQEINNKKVPVRVSFKKLAACEAGFEVGQYNHEFPLIIDPILTWNTFMGSSDYDYGMGGIAADGSGNVYVTGYSESTWGSPVNAHAGSYDVFVAKLNSSGALQWNTFIGSADDDHSRAIAIDSSGDVYVTGQSDAAWGSPVNAHAGSADIFIAKLNNNGALQWSTFAGSSNFDEGIGIAVDNTYNVYVTGFSHGTWGSPVNAHAGSSEIFAVKLNSSGVVLWNTFMGSSGTGASGWDSGTAITIDGSNNVYVTGSSWASWGSPVNAHSTGLSADVVFVKLNNNGVLQWNTFMGTDSFDDYGNSIVTDDSGNVYVAGTSWGADDDAFVAKLDNNGVFQWNNVIDSLSMDEARGIALDDSGGIYVVGGSTATWGSPVDSYTGGWDVFVVKYNNAGTLMWNTFMGSSSTEKVTDIAVDTFSNIYVAGYGGKTWGSPVNAFTGSYDVFVAKFSNNGAILPWVPLLLLVD